MQSRATPQMYFCVEVVRELFTDKPLKHCPEKKLKKNEKRERKRCLKLLGVRGGFWQSSAEKWEGQRNYSLKDSLHKDANSCFSIRKDQRIEVRAKSFALHSPFARNFFVTWVSCEHGLWCVQERLPASHVHTPKITSTSTEMPTRVKHVFSRYSTCKTRVKPIQHV